jgi:PAS domain S-box-containing protein
MLNNPRLKSVLDEARAQLERSPRDPSVYEGQSNAALIQQLLLAETALEIQEARLRQPPAAPPQDSHDPTGETFRQVVQQAHEGIYIVNEDGQVMLWNDSMQRTTGIPSSEALGKLIWDVRYELLPTEQQSEVHYRELRKRIQATLATGVVPYEGNRFQARLRRRGGQMRTIEATVGAIATARGYVLTTVHRDITEQLQAAKQIQMLQLETERSRVLHDFIRDASHEFRNPLNVIQNNLFLLENSSDPERQERLLSRLRESVGTISELVEGLITLARLDSEPQFTYIEIQVNSLMLSAITQLDEACQARLDLDLSPDLPRSMADADNLMRAFYELLINACRHTSPDGKIVVRSYRQGDQAIFEVRDQGPGIPPDRLSRIFERFYRGDNAHTTAGLGLGLPIARRIVEVHGGTLTVESTPDEGSTFRVSLLIL